jgi:hypothetical protein
MIGGNCADLAAMVSHEALRKFSDQIGKAFNCDLASLVKEVTIFDSITSSGQSNRPNDTQSGANGTACQLGQLCNGRLPIGDGLPPVMTTNGQLY